MAGDRGFFQGGVAQGIQAQQQIGIQRGQLGVQNRQLDQQQQQAEQQQAAKVAKQINDDVQTFVKSISEVVTKGGNPKSESFMRVAQRLEENQQAAGIPGAVSAQQMIEEGISLGQTPEQQGQAKAVTAIAEAEAIVGPLTPEQKSQIAGFSENNPNLQFVQVPLPGGGVQPAMFDPATGKTTPLENFGPGDKSPLVQIGAEDKAQQVFDTAIAGRGAAKFGQLQDRIGPARNLQRQVAQFKQLSEGIQTGKFAPTRTQLKRIAKGFGVDIDALGIDDNIAAAQVIDAISGAFALEFISLTKGSVSDAEMEFFKSLPANLGNDPEANTILLRSMERAAELDIEVAELARNYVKENGRLDIGWDERLAEFQASKPLLDKDDLADLLDATAGALPDSPAGTAAPVDSEADAAAVVLLEGNPPAEDIQAFLEDNPNVSETQRVRLKQQLLEKLRAAKNAN